MNIEKMSLLLSYERLTNVKVKRNVSGQQQYDGLDNHHIE